MRNIVPQLSSFTLSTMVTFVLAARTPTGGKLRFTGGFGANWLKFGPILANFGPTTKKNDR